MTVDSTNPRMKKMAIREGKSKKCKFIPVRGSEKYKGL
jgi:hypothetical protein